MKQLSILFIILIFTTFNNTQRIFSREPIWCLGGHIKSYGKAIINTEITPDNKYLITCGADATVRIFDIFYSNMVCCISEESSNSITVSNDSKFLITNNGFVYSIPDGLIKNIINDSIFKSSNYLTIDKNSDSVVIVYSKNIIKHINYFTGNVVIKSINEVNNIGDNTFYRNFLFNKNSDKAINYDFDNGVLSVVDLYTGKILKQKNFSEKNLLFDIDSSFRYLYIFFQNYTENKIFVFDFNTFEEINTINLLEKPSGNLKISPDGKYLFISTLTELHIYNLDNNSINAKIPMTSFYYNFLKGTNSSILTDWYGRMSALLDCNSFNISKNIFCHDEQIKNIAFSMNDKYFSSIMYKSNNILFQVFDIEKRIRFLNFTAPFQKCTNDNYDWVVDPFIQFSPSSVLIAGGTIGNATLTNSLYFINLSDSTYKQYIGHKEPITKAIFSNDESHIISVSLDSTLRLWNINSGIELNRIDFPYKLINISESPDDKYYYIVYNENQNSSLIRYDKLTKEIKQYNINIHSYSGNSSAYSNVFSKNAKYFAYQNNSSINIFDLDSEKVIHSIPFSYSTDYFTPLKLSFSKDNNYLLIVGDSLRAEIWDFENNILKANNFYFPSNTHVQNNSIGYNGAASILSCCFANEHKWFAFSTNDASAVIWDYSDITAVEDNYYTTIPKTKSVFLKENIIYNNELNFLFESVSDKPVSIEIYDYIGNLIDTYNPINVYSPQYSHQIKISNYLTGRYFCRVYINGNYEILNFIVNN